MCDNCRRVVIEIVNPHLDSERKYSEALARLQKSFGVPGPLSDAAAAREVSPYRSARELEEEIQDTVEDRLFRLYRAISVKWLGLSKAEDDVFKLNGKTFLNPRTGKPLKTSEWDVIKKDLNRAFTWIYGDQEDRIVKEAMALGKILRTMSTQDAVKSALETMRMDRKRIEEALSPPEFDDVIAFTEQQTGDYITDITDRSLKMIRDVIRNGYREKKHSNQLQLDLFNEFGAMNRDWRRIAATETAAAVNNGFITEAVRSSDQDYVLMKGISAPDACDFCSSMINGKVFAAVQSQPEDGDTLLVNGKPYTAIWPGKSNVGRKRQDWWVAFPSHPHCRCSLSEYAEGFEEEEEMLREAMEQARIEYENRKG